eukprot:TRINITY_DN10819_c0_g1_i2.p1 TRINITY_DN10819_c0_g1~~TRINITY_DN10819_c0_g1_i2.p1  ORF type:complete len:436 (+),score=73.84 TRINITY_DN10819_c0_g1_i2:48-1355(+)
MSNEHDLNNSILQTNVDKHKYHVLFYKIIILSFLAIMICYADRSNIATAIIQMQREFNWSQSTKGMLLSSFYWGYTFIQIPSGYLSKKYGGYKLLLYAVGLWSLFTFLTPLASKNMMVLVFCRVLMGISEGISFPAIHDIIANYILHEDQSKSVSIITTSSYIGTVLANYLTPIIVTQLGWEYAFYIFGLVGMIWCLPWSLLLNLSENNNIDENNDDNNNDDDVDIQEDVSFSEIPWKKIFQTKQIWAIIINQWCGSYGFYVLLNWIPSFYLSKGLELENQGLFLMLPFLFQGIIGFFSGFLADKLLTKGVSPTKVRQIFQHIGMIFPAIFLSLIIILPLNIYQIAGLLTLAIGMNAFTLSGVSVYHLDIAPQYSSILFSIGNTFGNLPGIIGVYFTGFLIDNYNSWEIIFLIAIFNYLIGSVAWFLLARGKVSL